MNKKSQIKFGETFAIIILVYIILVIGMVWYNNVSTNSIKEMQENDLRDRSFEKYSYIVNSEFLHVTSQGDIDEEFDQVSLEIFSNYSKSNKEFIRKQLGEATVIVELYDKNLKSIKNITIYDLRYDNSNNENRKNEERFKTLIPVKDTINKETNIGILNVIIYN
ncbi:MAG: hypothetical protein PF569_00745 [Candidatus Woesearchaeota archaeon]|jgi:hypothetical protein|nr:hypothetical protein [Candidatus Woesearchaeota archaeon]